MNSRKSSRTTYSRLLELVPTAPGWETDWSSIWSLSPDFPAMDACPQDPVYHAEGDVGTHTRMVVEALVRDPAWRALPDEDRNGLFWTAVLHDIGKPATTKHEDDGRITSRGHSRTGASMAREFFWEAGAPFYWRERICGLIGSHQLPFWLLERPHPVRLAIETSWKCRPDHLCLHARADMRGRICDDQQSVLENIDLAQSIFEEAGCYEKAFPFANDESRVAYFEREDRDPHYAAHEEFRCNVTVMSGLPGSGKDTWIEKNRPDLPIVSLDTIREETGASSTGNQGRVIQAAQERARMHLRAGQDFVWNATNITRQLRSKVLGLLRDYNAHIEIAYIEVGPDQLASQNAGRQTAVPVKALHHLARKLEPPGDWEAHRVLRPGLS